jgi:ubiquinone/menaquinone biosynthesis C-methylase UbiE
MGYSEKLATQYAQKRKKFQSSDVFLWREFQNYFVKNGFILDFGCGDGAEAERLLSFGFKGVTGIDSSRQMINLAKKRRISRAVFKLTDGKHIPSQKESFSTIYSRFVLHYIRNVSVQMKELSRVMKKDGSLIMIFQCLTNNSKLENAEVPICLGKGDDMVEITILAKSIKTVQKAVINAGMIVVKCGLVNNADSYINPKFKRRGSFKNDTYILIAKKL